MKIVSKTINDSETSVEIDLFEGLGALKKRTKARIQNEVGEFLVEQTLVHMNEKKSPVQGGGTFAPLSKQYKKRKLEEVGSSEANLEFDGQMKDETDFETTDDGIAIGVFGERAGAADGHNNLSGKSQLPLRQFLPDVGEKYKRPIEQEVKRIIADIVAEETKFKRSDFKSITTKKGLYDKLAEIFGTMTRSELSTAVYRNEELTDLLNDLDLLELL
jgi:hypothetical protein